MATYSETERVSREIKELTLLFEISRKLSESLDLKAALQSILRMMADNMEMLRGTLTILNRSSGEIVIEEAYGLLPEEQAKGKYRMGEGITGKVIDTGEPVIVPRISDNPLFLDRTGSREKLNKRDIAFICVPIKAGNEVIGTLSVDRLFNEGISFEEDVRLLTIIASTISQAVRLRQLAQEELDKVREENYRLQDELKIRYGPKTIIGNAKVMQNIYGMIDKVCRTNATVLILGESGVGKERVAHAIHHNSSYAGGPYVIVNCAALPESLIESELFGHEKGAFTGATVFRKGRFELADNGTIFLDEIGDLPPAVQTKLLRVLQERVFERIGGNTSIKVNIRVIAATNRDLEALIREGKFREDLYYRLNIFPIVVPPLRERKTDIILLTNHFIEKYAADLGRKIVSISAPATDLLMHYHWPGNVRELENCIERAMILCTDGIIQAHHLPPNLQKADETAINERKGTLREMLFSLEKELITDALKRSRGNMAKAARNLGLTERIMGLRVVKFAIDPGRMKEGGA
ncbi:MAG: sigma 54-interacting transcriptional regulator [Syntrophales bacterium]|nr:sigma 54-interacting transcriptional regulator [Syntrophales bacterium]